MHANASGSVGADAGRPRTALPIRAVVVDGGADPPLAAVRGRLPAGLLVLAADSGLDHALALGLEADVVVGDLDSVSDGALRAAQARGTIVDRHPAAKDASDLELALGAAPRRGATAVTVVGGAGGRLDHLLAGALLLASDAFADLAIDAYLGAAYVTVVRSSAQLAGRVGEPCTLLAAHGPAHGVRTEGLRYPLHGETLLPGSTRGLSNELVAPTATVTVGAGIVLAVLPESLRGDENR